MKMEMPPVEKAEKDQPGAELTIEGKKTDSPEDVKRKMEKKSPLDLFKEAGLNAEEVSEILELTGASLESTGYYGSKKSGIEKVEKASGSTIIVVTKQWEGHVMAGDLKETTFSLEKKDGKWKVVDSKSEYTAIS